MWQGCSLTWGIWTFSISKTDGARKHYEEALKIQSQLRQEHPAKYGVAVGHDVEQTWGIWIYSKYLLQQASELRRPAAQRNPDK